MSKVDQILSSSEAKKTAPKFDEKAVKKAIDTILKSVTSLGNGTRPLEGTTVSKAVAMVDGEAADRVIGIRQELDALNNELSGIAENIRWQLRNREDD